jgi:TolB-like protein/tetratricopeptide (TPR) repeat protein
MRRRRIFRTAALYIVGTWLVMQVADVVFPAIDIPERAIRYVLVAALLGFPAALVFSWFYDVGVHGIRRTAPLGSVESGTAQQLRRSDFLILTALVGVVVAIIYNAVGNVVEAPSQVQQSVREGPPMLAVLPFVSASLEGDSKFFATGVHDDLLTQLAHLQSIRVISRTSVLEYKDTVKNIREIGKALGADAILEGGVQSAGNRIRINAQLIDARTDEHLWAETYDRELSPASIFDVQSDIAHAITAAMKATLTVGDTEQLTILPTENMAAYRAYRRAMDIAADPAAGFYTFAYRDALEEAVALDPTFIRAMAELVGRQSYATFWEEDAEAAQRAEQLLEQIKALAPRSAEYLLAQAYYSFYALKNWEQAYQFVVQAQKMRPNDAHLLNLKNWIQRRQGDLDGRMETLLLARDLDPRNPQWTRSVVGTLMATHRYEEARKEIENSESEGYMLSVLHSMLLVQEHGDFGRRVQGVIDAQREFGRTNDFISLWEAHIANRDYAAAEEFTNTMPERLVASKNYEGDLSDKQWSQIVTYWIMGRDDKLKAVIGEAREDLEKSRNANGDFRNRITYGLMALLTAAEGKTEETERLIRRWRRDAVDDKTEVAAFRHLTCRMLGMAHATTSAIECIRTGLVEPSDVIPFIEPFLPHYDSMRDEPEFVELLAEIDAAAKSP